MLHKEHGSSRRAIMSSDPPARMICVASTSCCAPPLVPERWLVINTGLAFRGVLVHPQLLMWFSSIVFAGLLAAAAAVVRRYLHAEGTEALMDV